MVTGTLYAAGSFMKKLCVSLIALLFACGSATWIPIAVADTDEGEQGAGDYVVVLHGLGRTSRSMSKLARSMQAAGYQVVNVAYPSTRGDMPELVNLLDNTVRDLCTNDAKRVNFVTHSLGGIVVRCYLDSRDVDRLGRVVMLSPPNQGSEIADTLKSWWPYQLAMGPMGLQLGTGTNDLPRRLGPVTFDLGVITGDRSLNPLYSSVVKGRDDGKVSVESAKIAGMRDFLVVHSSHTFIMRRRMVIDQTLHFLKNGHFRE